MYALSELEKNSSIKMIKTIFKNIKNKKYINYINIYFIRNKRFIYIFYNYIFILFFIFTYIFCKKHIFII